jgi:hypothetical protein
MIFLLCQAVEKGSFTSLRSTDFASTYKSTPPLFARLTTEPF